MSDLYFYKYEIGKSNVCIFLKDAHIWLFYSYIDGNVTLKKVKRSFSRNIIAILVINVSIVIVPYMIILAKALKLKI